MTPLKNEDQTRTDSTQQCQVNLLLLLLETLFALMERLTRMVQSGGQTISINNRHVDRHWFQDEMWTI